MHGISFRLWMLVFVVSRMMGNMSDLFKTWSAFMKNRNESSM